MYTKKYHQMMRSSKPQPYNEPHKLLSFATTLDIGLRSHVANIIHNRITNKVIIIFTTRMFSENVRNIDYSVGMNGVVQVNIGVLWGQ